MCLNRMQQIHNQIRCVRNTCHINIVEGNVPETHATATLSESMCRKHMPQQHCQSKCAQNFRQGTENRKERKQHQPWKPWETWKTLETFKNTLEDTENMENMENIENLESRKKCTKRYVYNGLGPEVLSTPPSTFQ